MPVFVSCGATAGGAYRIAGPGRGPGPVYSEETAAGWRVRPLPRARPCAAAPAAPVAQIASNSPTAAKSRAPRLIVVAFTLETGESAPVDRAGRAHGRATASSARPCRPNARARDSG